MTYAVELNNLHKPRKIPLTVDLRRMARGCVRQARRRRGGDLAGQLLVELLGVVKTPSRGDEDDTMLGDEDEEATRSMVMIHLHRQGDDVWQASPSSPTKVASPRRRSSDVAQRELLLP